MYLANNIQIVGEMRFGTKDALVKGLPIPGSFTKQLKIMEKNNVPIVKSLHTGLMCRMKQATDSQSVCSWSMLFNSRGMSLKLGL